MSIEIISASHQTIGRNVVIYPMLQNLNVSETINRYVKTEGEIPFGTIAEIVILSRFAKERVPMYLLEAFCSQNGISTIYGIEAEKLNDDRVGRFLDALQPEIPSLKTALILQAIKTFSLDVSQIHTDITNILFEGSYEEIPEGELKVTYGHTKKGQDSRCKQVNFSLSVTADYGVPLWYESLSGNTADNVCYLPHLSAFQNELGITSPLIVGDSKLVSQSNMLAFCSAGALFIGPATLDENEKKRLQKLWEKGIPFSALQLKAEKNKPIPYWGMEGEREITDKKKKEKYKIRHVYIFSRQGRSVIRHTRAKNFKAAKAALHKIRRCLNKYDYKTPQIIHSRIQNQVLSKCPYYRIQLNHDSDGFYSITYSIDWEKLAKDCMFDGIYVLRTNCPKEQFSICAILESYKGQTHIERCFQTLKQPPIQVSPLWLHNPQRIESLLFLLFLALMLISLLQRFGRQKVSQKKIPLRPEGRDNIPLTAPVLLKAFDTFAIYTITFLVNGQIETETFFSQLSLPQREVLWALSFPSPKEYLKKQ